MQRFPGRTLEELDNINWPRLMRAVDAGEILRIEDVREAQIRKQVKPSAEDWRAIQHHDELMGLDADETEDDA